MGAISSGGLHCPVCGDSDMYEELAFDYSEVLYWCSTCGYRNEFKIVEDKNGKKYVVWDGRCQRRKFVKWVPVEKRHGLAFIGKRIPFYPDEHWVDEILLRPKDKQGKLVWRLYSLVGQKKFLGEFRRFDEAQEYGFKYTQYDPEEFAKLSLQRLEENLKSGNARKRAYMAWALGVKRNFPATELLIRLLNDRSAKVRTEAACALTQITGKDYSITPIKWQRWWRRNRRRIQSQENSAVSLMDT